MWFRRNVYWCTYCDQIIGICAVKVRDADACWKRFLALECLVETLSKVRLDTQGLKDEYTHSDQALLGRVVALINCIIEHQNNEVMSSVRIDDKGAKPFVALKCFPEKHDHFRCPCQRFLASWQVRGSGLELVHLAKVAHQKEKPTGWFRILVIPSTRNWKSCGRCKRPRKCRKKFLGGGPFPGSGMG